MRRLATALALLFVVLGGAAVIKINTLKAAVASEALRADSIEARNTKTIEFLLEGRKAYLARAVQAELRGDELDKKWKIESKLRASFQAKIASIDGTIVMIDSTVRDTSARIVGIEPETVSTEFTDYKAPFTLSERIIVGPTPEGLLQWGVMWRIDVDSFSLKPRVGCGPETPAGVRPAYLAMEVPSWLTIRVDTLQQDPNICSSKAVATATRKEPNRLMWFLIGSAVGVGGTAWLVDKIR